MDPTEEIIMEIRTYSELKSKKELHQHSGDTQPLV